MARSCCALELIARPNTEVAASNRAIKKVRTICSRPFFSVDCESVTFYLLNMPLTLFTKDLIFDGFSGFLRLGGPFGVAEGEGDGEGLGLGDATAAALAFAD